MKIQEKDTAIIAHARDEMSAELTEVKVALDLKLFKVEGTLKLDEVPKKAAWELYVELITRISVEELKLGEGLLREALRSLYSLFGVTREILRKYGYKVADPLDGNLSLGYLAVGVLNLELRPFLTKWHPLLLDYESRRESHISQMEHEAKWDKNEEFRKELDGVRINLTKYANILCEAIGILPFHEIEKQ